MVRMVCMVRMACMGGVANWVYVVVVWCIGVDGWKVFI